MMCVAVGLMSIVPAAYGQSNPPPTSSASDSPKSSTPAIGERSAVGGRQSLINACAAAVDELKATRDYVTAVEQENALLKERLATEKAATKIYAELNETRRSESEALRETVLAKNETIAAKDAAIAKQDELIAALKNKKSSPWKRVGDILLGVGVAAILR